MSRLRLRNAFIYLLSTMLLSACGGGNGTSQPEISYIEVAPRAALFTEAGQKKAFSATAYDARGQEVDATFTWSSSRLEVISVDQTGQVASTTLIGSATITASAGEVTSNAAMVVTARTVAGTLLIDDEQVVGEIVPVNPNTPLGVSFQFETTLTGISLPAVGILISGTGELPIGGRVVSSSQQGETVLVTFEVVRLEELFTELVIEETVDLSLEPLVLAQIIADNYDMIEGPRGVVEFHLSDGVPPSQSPGQRPERAGRGAAGTRLLNPGANLGPFSCEWDISNPLVLDGLPASFTVTNNLTAIIDYKLWSGGLQELTLLGEMGAKFEAANTLSAALDGNVSCRVILGEVKVRVPGPAGLVLGAYVPMGAGFEINGKVALAEVGFELTAEGKADLKAGLKCPGGQNCTTVTSLDTDSSADFKWTTPQLSSPLAALAQLRIEPALSGFAFADLQVGTVASALRFEVLKTKAGLKQAASFAIVEGQMADSAYTSDYVLSLDASVTMGETIDNYLNKMNLTLLKEELKLDEPLATSPKALSVISDVQEFQDQDLVHFTVKLDPASFNYPIVGYNVDQIILYRRMETPQGGIAPAELLDIRLAIDGQTEFDFLWTADHDGTVAGNFFAFVKPVVPPFPSFDHFELKGIDVGEFALHYTDPAGGADLQYGKLATAYGYNSAYFGDCLETDPWGWDGFPDANDIVPPFVEVDGYITGGLVFNEGADQTFSAALSYPELAASMTTRIIHTGDVVTITANTDASVTDVPALCVDAEGRGAWDGVADAGMWADGAHHGQALILDVENNTPQDLTIAVNFDMSCLLTPGAPDLYGGGYAGCYGRVDFSVPGWLQIESQASANEDPVTGQINYGGSTTASESRTFSVPPGISQIQIKYVCRSSVGHSGYYAPGTSSTWESSAECNLEIQM